MTLWKARIARAPHKYHRVEVEGATIADDPIALVIDPAHATAIAALPDVVAALRDARVLLEKCTCMATGVARDQADEALAKMEGR